MCITSYAVGLVLGPSLGGRFEVASMHYVWVMLDFFLIFENKLSTRF